MNRPPSAHPVLRPILGALVAGLVLLAARADAGPNKIDVCHWSDTDQAWSLKSVPENAVGNHLSNHDDASPGDVTPSGTTLDADCQPVDEDDGGGSALLCPCWSAYTEQELIQVFAPALVNYTLECYETAAADSFIIDYGSSNDLAVNNATTPPTCSSSLEGTTTGSTEDGADTCTAELVALMGQLGC